ncbi:MAG: aminotransferase class I/II-fold pyridoxal phosphate-dependent enzyme, partial [Pirellulales bacterium]
DDPRVVAAATRSAHEHGWGAGASPLITGRHPVHARLEARLAEFMGTEAALVFPTGFAANLGTIAALVGRGDVVFSDALNHASLIDGCRLSRATIEVYRHGDLAQLEQQLAAPQSRSAHRRLIVTDALFSMDGQAARLRELCELAERHDAMLLVDEAHALGVVGSQGRGVCEAMAVESRVSIRMGTLSKALGSSGGFVAGSARLIDWLANRARPYVFSTAGTPAAAAAALAALEIVAGEPQRRRQLHDRLEMLTGALMSQGWRLAAAASDDIAMGTATSRPTLGAIVPIVVGDSQRALRLSAQLGERGLWVPAIRPPTVPAGTARLRISLSSAHTPEMLDRLITALGELRPEADGE